MEEDLSEIQKGQEEEEEKYEGFPRPGGDFVAPGKNIHIGV
jgi:hypothetical protein